MSDRGSPSSVAVKSPVVALEPRGVAINQRGEVVVTERGGQLCLSPNGEKLRSFGAPGSGQGQFTNLFGVADDGEGNILVSDGDNHHIQKFTAEGQFLRACSMRTGKVYVADTINHRIQVFTASPSPSPSPMRGSS